jgi:hypothetical protein
MSNSSDHIVVDFEDRGGGSSFDSIAAIDDEDGGDFDNQTAISKSASVQPLLPQCKL